jgi:very-short-patch-repair endonuclease
VQLSGLLAAERRIAALARRQHGVVSRTQLLHADVSSKVIDNRVRAGWLRPIHRGVYLVGPTQSEWAREMAAVLGCGDGSVVSHATAAALWGLLPYPARDRPVEVTVPIGRVRRRRGIRVHRADLEHEEVTKLKRIPVTTPTRTLLDLASCASLPDLEEATAKALATHRTSREKLLALLARYPHRHGAPRLRALVEARPRRTRSDTEKRFLALVRRAQLPTPDTNVMLRGYEVDALWREDRLVVELDSWAHHSSRAMFEADRRRDAELAAEGLRVVRITWRQIVDEPEAVVARLARALNWAP